MDCSPFLNWTEKPFKSVRKTAVVFRSLVATLKLKPVLDVSLDAKAVKFLESVQPDDEKKADDFISNFGRTIDKSSTNFVQSIVVLVSSSSTTITTAAMLMLKILIENSSPKVRLALVNANLIPQLINNLNLLSLSFTEAGNIHIYLMKSINKSFWLATPDGLYRLKIQNQNEPQAVHETISRQAIAPSEMYIGHLCVNRYSRSDC
ncbi:hypothetical protein BLNAU_7504 [Blattamonas nauphoetae]|uniref:Uncharacterized protein n=1 Tax=Blattamonas nauphoetae TaxID=2049346 RepID=A0ABQ9Y1J8_9EUKA|nr:hypothetical protein BLNAU_7504 [Blattamonas nauphoetae]